MIRSIFFKPPCAHRQHGVVESAVEGLANRTDACKRPGLGDKVSKHLRCWGKEQVRYNPIHYIALLERKPGALDFAKPFEDWDLPESLHRLRKHLEAKRGEDGKRDYISILRLLEKHSLERLGAAVETALEMNCPSKALIEQCLYHEDRETDVFKLDGREHLKGVQVDTTDLSAYQLLLKGNSKGKEVA